MTLKSSLFLILAVALPAAGLSWLGLRARDAEESRAALRAREALGAAERTLSARAAFLLAKADRAADGWETSTPPPPSIEAVFVADPSGRVHVPALHFFPAVNPPAEEEEAAVRSFLAEADRVLAAGGDALTTIPVLEAVLGDFLHPDLSGVLFLRTARLYEQAGREDRARFLLSRIAEDLPSARDLGRRPIAPYAQLRLVELSENGERAEAALSLGERLADHAWGLSAYERDLILARLGEILAPHRLPAEVARRVALVDALRIRVLPVATAGLSDPAARAWRHTVHETEGATRILGYRALDLDSGPHVFGFLLAETPFAREMGIEAEALSRLSGGGIEVGLSPPLRAGAAAGEGAFALTGDLGGELRSIPVRLTLPPPEGIGTIGILHVAMTVVLAVGLGLGAWLSVRAVRREIHAARVKQDVSHELRTPLTSIRMYAEMLEEEEDLPEAKRSRYRGFILSESERLSRLIEDVLAFSRIDRGEAPFEPEAVRPAELVEAAVSRIEPLCEEAGFVVRVSVPDDLPAARADRDACVRTLVNLLTNAIRYSGDAREVGIAGDRDGDRILLTVRDRGPGVPPEARPYLFDRFYRAPRDARKVRGIGLGLGLARELARAQGGDLWLAEGDGPGSRFTLALRVAGEGEE